MAEIQLTQASDGQTVRARPGDVVVIRLDENPTTGFRWVVTGGPAPSGDTFSVRSGAPGSGGERVLQFVIARAMTMQVSAVLKREWETDSAPRARFGVTIVAH